MALVVEALVRIPLLAISLLAVGLPGLPIAATATALTAAVLIYRRTLQELDREHPREPPAAGFVWLARAVLVGLAAAVALTVLVPHWSYVVVAAIVITLGGCLILLGVDPMLRSALRPATREFLQIVTFARRHG